MLVCEFLHINIQSRISVFFTERIRMTIEDIKNMPKSVLTPGDIAPLLNCDPNVIRYQAATDIRQLGFPAAKIGSRVKIPKDAFVKWFEGSENK